MGDEYVIPPPSSADVDGPRTVLYDAYDRPLTRTIGFKRQEAPTMTQTRGTFPALSDGVKKTIPGSKPPKKATRKK